MAVERIETGEARPDFAAVAARRKARQWEGREQRKLVRLLRRLLDPSCTFFSSLENKPMTAVSGALQRRRGCRSGLPDLMTLWPGRVVFVELKSKTGYLSATQKETREELLRAGAGYWVAMSATAALTALLRSGAPFRRPWTPVELRAWEGPFPDTVRIPRAPEILKRRREERRRWRERQRVRKHATVPEDDDSAQSARGAGAWPASEAASA